MTRLFNFLKIGIPGLLLLAMLACSANQPTDSPPSATDAPPPLAAAEPSLSPVAATSPDAKQPQAAPSAIPKPPPTAVAVPSGRRGGSLVVAAMSQLPHRDLHQNYQETLAAPGPGLAYSRLLRVDYGPRTAAAGFPLICDLCASWELTPDWAYQFQLRPGVRWHNLPPVNGRELTADDVAFSIERLRTPGWPGAARLSDRGIGSIEVIDDHALRVNLNFLDSDALAALADGHSKIIAPELIANYGDLKQAPVIGTGPWLWDESDTGALHRNPHYFHPELPYLDQLTIRAIPGPADPAEVNWRRIALLQADSVDVLAAAPTDWPALRDSIAPFNARVSLQPEIGIALILNTQAAPLDNPAIRRAIFKALDPWEYVDLTWDGQGAVGLGLPLPNPDWQLSRAAMHADYLSDPSAARHLLTANGIYDPLPVQLTVTDLGPDYRALGEQVASDLQAVGFAPNLTLTPPDAVPELFSRPHSQRNYQILLGPLPPHPTVNGYLYALLHSQGPGNPTGHQDAILDGLIERQAAELNPARRQALLQKVQRRILDQGLMFSPVAGSYRWVFAWDVKNLYPNTALGEYHYWAEVWRERPRQ